MYSPLLSRFSTLSKSHQLLYFGSSNVGIAPLRYIAPHFPNLQVITHYTPPQRKLTNQVQIYCQQNRLPFQTPIKQHTDKSKRRLEWQLFASSFTQKPALGVVCSYGFLIPDEVIDLFEMGMIVVHPSLLPKYKGGAPIFHAIANGQKQSGVSYVQISKNKFDSGNILHKVKTQIGQTDPYDTIEQNLAELAGQNIMNVLQNVEKLRPGISQESLLHEVPQHLQVAPIIREKGLDLSKTAVQVYNWSRALKTPRVKFNGQEIMVYFDRQFMEDGDGKYEVGDVVFEGKRVFVRCKDKLLKLRGWQQPAKKYLLIHTFRDRFNPTKSASLRFG